MKFLFMVLVMILSATGCSSKYDFGTPEMKEAKAKKSFFIVRSDDNKIGILSEAATNAALDGVYIQVARSLTAAADKIIKETSARFTEPDELPRNASEMTRGLTSEFLSVSFFIKNGKKTVKSSAFSKDLKYKTFDHTNPYYSLTGLNFSCEGDTEKVCTKKFMKTAGEAIKPVIVRFIKDHGY
jgi:hypothetical protein